MNKEETRKIALEILEGIYNEINWYSRGLGHAPAYTAWDIWEGARTIMEGLPKDEPPTTQELQAIEE